MICRACKQEMNEAVSCVKVPVEICAITEQGEVLTTKMDPVPHNRGQNCGDCKAPPGGWHHPGCDQERCPQCSGQLISCGCLG